MEKQTWNEFFHSWSYVYWKTSTLVGAPILFCLILVAAQKTFFTGTCALAGYQCKYGFGSAESIASSVSNAVSGDKSSEVSKAPSDIPATFADLKTGDLQGWIAVAKEELEYRKKNKAG